MLVYLYNLLEKILLATYDELCHFDYRTIGLTNGLLILLISCFCCAVTYINLRSLSNKLVKLIDNIFNWKQVNFSVGISLFVESINELKFSLVAQIIIFALFGWMSVHLYHPRNGGGGRFGQHDGIIDILFARNDDDDIDLDADLDMNDGQNVHNGTITKHAVESIKRLVDHEKSNSIIPQTLSDIHTEIQSYLTLSNHPSSRIAIDVLNEIYNFNHNHVASGLREMEILRLIWQRIKNPINHDKLTDLKMSLLMQLVDCKPNGTLMCLTGRVTRMLQTLECIDNEHIVDLKPLWAIKEQIGDYCSRYYDKLLKKIPPNYTNAQESFNRTPEQKILTTNFNNCLKKNLNQKFKIMYIDTKILTSEQLNELTATYYENISI